MKNAKRLLKEKTENETPDEFFYVQPVTNDMFKWHFTLRGMPGSPYEGGLYHGYFDIPNDYPFSPPNIYYLNESGRYQPNTKLCLTITTYHKEEWSPAWTIRSMTQAMCSHFIVDDSGIGSIVKTTAERKRIAIESRKYKCPHCGPLESIEKLILDKHLKPKDSK